MANVKMRMMNRRNDLKGPLHNWLKHMQKSLAHHENMSWREALVTAVSVEEVDRIILAASGIEMSPATRRKFQKAAALRREEVAKIWE